MTEQSNDTEDRQVALLAIRQKSSLESTLLCGLAVVCFSLTLPVTKAAIPELGALFVAVGRSVVAGVVALGVLVLRREPFPRAHLGALSFVAAGVVFGFPITLALGLRSVPSTHASILIGSIPIVTALYAMLRSGERPSAEFWGASLAGAAAVAFFAQSQGGIELSGADGWLILSVGFAAFGYSEGARLARDLGGLRVISWALVLALPLSAPISFLTWPERGLFSASSGALAGFGYVALVSMYLGMIAWYRGLSRGSLARASQIQLIQPVLSLAWAWLLLGEELDPITLVAAMLVLACAAWARRARVALPEVRASASARAGWASPIPRAAKAPGGPAP